MSRADRVRRNRASGALVAVVVAGAVCVQPPVATASAPVLTPAKVAASPVSAVGSAVGSASAADRPLAPRRILAPYRGLATWVDIYDARLWASPRATVEAMHAKRVRSIFLQVAYNDSHGIVRTRALDRFIETAHRLRMHVVAWYLPTFADIRVARGRSLAAIRYRTDGGQRFDGFGLDIEGTEVKRVSTRLRRLLRLSHQIEDAVRPSFSLAAITPSPYGMREAPQYWGRPRKFPFDELARIYDVIAPMSYFTYRVEGRPATHDYTAFNIRTVRRVSGDARVPIHPIGGLGNDSSRPEVRGYVQALREGNVLGGSLYDFKTTKRLHWPVLRRVPVGR